MNVDQLHASIGFGSHYKMHLCRAHGKISGSFEDHGRGAAHSSINIVTEYGHVTTRSQQKIILARIQTWSTP
jgi:hypothetical protein